MKLLLAFTLLSALVLAGCSGSGGEGTVPPQDDEGRYIIRLTSANQFSPETAKVPVGATVRWVHDGGAPHDVQGDGFSSGVTGGMDEGDTFDHEFTEAGTYRYECAVHAGAGMTGTVIVSDE